MQIISEWCNDPSWQLILRFFIHWWLKCKSFWTVGMFRDFYINCCLTTTSKEFIVVKFCSFFMLHRRHSFNWGLSIFCVVLKGLCFTKLCQRFCHWKWFSCKIYQYFSLSKAIVFYELCGLFLSRQMNHGTLLISWLLFFGVITCAYSLHLHLVFFSLLSLIVLIIILLFIAL